MLWTQYKVKYIICLSNKIVLLGTVMLQGKIDLEEHFRC